MKKFICILTICCSFFCVTGCGESYLTTVSDEVVSTEVMEDTTFSNDVAEIEKNAEANALGQSSKSIFVQVVGAVLRPGVYELQEGDRVFQAVQKAGGYMADADIEYTNGARTLSDGECIYVYSIEETTMIAELANDADSVQVKSLSGAAFMYSKNGYEASTADDGLININTADVDALTTLPGIGSTRAKMIVEYRQNNGRFNSIEEITNVSGIGDATLANIRSLIKV